MWGILFLTFLFLIALAGLILGAVSLGFINSGGRFYRSILIHPSSSNYRNQEPTITFSGATSASLTAGSNDTSGSVVAAIPVSTAGVFDIAFERPFAKTPNAVTLTLARAFAATEVISTSVTAVTTTGFQATVLVGTGGVAAGTLFYYNVL